MLAGYNESGTWSGAVELARFVYRPIVFSDPDRVVHPPSWLEHIPFAFWIVDVLRPATFVELGTHSGNSYAGFAQAIQMLGLPTAAYAVDTWRGDSQAGFYDEGVFTEWASYHDQHFSAFSRLVRSTFEEAAAHFPDASVDLVHLDGCHIYGMAAADFALWRPKLSRRGVVLMHDINVRERDFGAWRLWEELKASYPSFEFLHGHGLGVLGVGTDLPSELTWLFSRPVESGGDIYAVRTFFAKLGGAVSARYASQEVGRALRGEFDRQLAEQVGSAQAAIAERDARLAEQAEASQSALAEQARAAQAAIAERDARVAEQAEASQSALAEQARAAQAAIAERDARVAEQAEATQAALAARDARISEHVEATRATLAERDSRISEHTASLARLTNELTSTRTELTIATRERAESRRRIEAEFSQLRAALRHKARLVAKLQQRLISHGERDSRATPARELIAAAPQKISTARDLGQGRLMWVRKVLSTLGAVGALPTRRRRRIRRSGIKALTQPARLRQARAIMASGLFDEVYYRGRNPDVVASRMTPLMHYLLTGGAEGRNPHPLFDGAHYLRHNPDIASAGLNPLLHYRGTGAFEGRNPHPLFDVSYYLSMNPDVRSAGVEPLAHYLLTGGAEGRNPHPLFDGAYYLRHNPDVASAGLNPLLHYRGTGAFERRNPHPLFDVSYYLSMNPDIRSAGVEPLEHFLTFGAAEGRNPNPFFDALYYLRQNPDVAASGLNPLVHFAVAGWREGRRPSAEFDPQYYVATYSDARRSGENPLAHYLEYGQFEGRWAAAKPEGVEDVSEVEAPTPDIVLKVRSRGPVKTERPTVVCLSHVMPFPPRAGNEYRVYRMLRWLQDRGYRIVPVVAPLPGYEVTSEGIWALAEQFSNAVLCERDGRVEYVLRDIPDVLASLAGHSTRPVHLLLDDHHARSEHDLHLLGVDRTFCHDVAITVTTRLQEALGPHVLLVEYIWMSRILPLVSDDVVKVIDTHDVSSSQRQQVLRFGTTALEVAEPEEAKRLWDADLVIAIQDEERQQLARMVPGKPVVTAGVDFDVVDDPGVAEGRRVLYVASANPLNRKGIADFLRFAWPQVRREVPDAELLLVGDICDAVPLDVPGVRRLGQVSDLAGVYRTARLTINPAVAGTGLKIKTLEALGHLRPIVSWPNGTEGLAPELSALCEVVTDWYQFGKRVSRLLSTPEPRLFSPVERETIVRLTSPEHVYAGLTSALKGLLDARVAARATAASPAWR